MALKCVAVDALASAVVACAANSKTGVAVAEPHSASATAQGPVARSDTFPDVPAEL